MDTRAAQLITCGEKDPRSHGRASKIDARSRIAAFALDATRPIPPEDPMPDFCTLPVSPTGQQPWEWLEIEGAVVGG